MTMLIVESQAWMLRELLPKQAVATAPDPIEAGCAH